MAARRRTAVSAALAAAVLTWVAALPGAEGEAWLAASVVSAAGAAAAAGGFVAGLSRRGLYSGPPFAARGAARAASAGRLAGGALTAADAAAAEALAERIQWLHGEARRLQAELELLSRRRLAAGGGTEGDDAFGADAGEAEAWAAAEAVHRGGEAWSDASADFFLSLGADEDEDDDHGDGNSTKDACESLGDISYFNAQKKAAHEEAPESKDPTSPFGFIGVNPDVANMPRSCFDALMGKVMAFVLLGGLVALMLMIYMATYPDPQIQNYSAKLACLSLCIFAAVLLEKVQMSQLIRDTVMVKASKAYGWEKYGSWQYSLMNFGVSAALSGIWYLLITCVNYKFSTYPVTMFAANAFVSHTAAFVSMAAYGYAQKSLVQVINQKFAYTGDVIPYIMICAVYMVSPMLVHVLFGFYGKCTHCFRSCCKRRLERFDQMAAEAVACSHEVSTAMKIAVGVVSLVEPTPPPSSSSDSLPPIIVTSIRGEANDLDHPHIEMAKLASPPPSDSEVSLPGVSFKARDRANTYGSGPRDRASSTFNEDEHHHEHLPHWEHSAMEGEHDCKGLLVSFLLRQAMLFIITNRIPSMKGDEEVVGAGHFIGVGFVMVVACWVIVQVQRAHDLKCRNVAEGEEADDLAVAGISDMQIGQSVHGHALTMHVDTSVHGGSLDVEAQSATATDGTPQVAVASTAVAGRASKRASVARPPPLQKAQSLSGFFRSGSQVSLREARRHSLRRAGSATVLSGRAQSQTGGGLDAPVARASLSGNGGASAEPDSSASASASGRGDGRSKLESLAEESVPEDAASVEGRDSCSGGSSGSTLHPPGRAHHSGDTLLHHHQHSGDGVPHHRPGDGTPQAHPSGQVERHEGPALSDTTPSRLSVRGAEAPPRDSAGSTRSDSSRISGTRSRGAPRVVRWGETRLSMMSDMSSGVSLWGSPSQGPAEERGPRGLRTSSMTEEGEGLLESNMHYEQLVACMLVAWSILVQAHWFCRLFTSNISLLTLSAAVLLTPAMLFVLILSDKLVDFRIVDENVGMCAINAAGFVIGFGWEVAFAVAIDTATEDETFWDAVVCIGLMILILPAWRKGIVPAAIQKVPPRL